MRWRAVPGDRPLFPLDGSGELLCAQIAALSRTANASLFPHFPPLKLFTGLVTDHDDQCTPDSAECVRAEGTWKQISHSGGEEVAPGPPHLGLRPRMLLLSFLPLC